MRTECGDVCEAVIDIICLDCPKRKKCLFGEDNESEFHEQLIECFGENIGGLRNAFNKLLGDAEKHGSWCDRNDYVPKLTMRLKI